jgi:hypothetical protein
MITWIAGLLISGGVPQRYARAATMVLLGIAVLLALWGAKCAYDHHVISTHDTKVENKVLKKTQAATDQAATERANDTIRVEHQEQEAHNAIHQGADSAPSAAAVRHDCGRLRRAGKDTSRIAACSGH